jgi:hypothetical protein
MTNTPISINVSSDTPTLYSGGYVSSQVSLTTASSTTPVLIATFPAAFNGGMLLNATGPVWVGNSTVTSATGFPVTSTANVVIPGGKGVDRALYACCTTGTPTVSYLFAD